MITDDVYLIPIQPADADITGVVPCSPPEECFDQRTVKERLSEYLSSHPRQSYHYRVVGMSMRGAGILDGDVVTVNTRLEPISGKIVLAVVDGNRLTLKRFIVTKTGAYLISDSGSKRELIIAASEIEIKGVVTAVSRQLV